LGLVRKRNIKLKSFVKISLPILVGHFLRKQKPFLCMKYKGKTISTCLKNNVYFTPPIKLPGAI
jgi:hypothetical protein